MARDRPGGESETLDLPTTRYACSTCVTLHHAKRRSICLEEPTSVISVACRNVASVERAGSGRFTKILHLPARMHDPFILQVVHGIHNITEELYAPSIGI